MVLAVEQLGQATQAELRGVLGRDGDFVELLRAAVSASSPPAILIFDGFDAARGENERGNIFRLILRSVNELANQWNVIVSVRTFDANKSRRLLELFPDKTSATGVCRQFIVPPLRKDEIEQVFSQVLGLRELYFGGTNELRTLLSVPFNLWLIECSLQAGAKTEEFSQIISEVQLLEMYWNYRVRRAADAEDREVILAKTSRVMVANRTLSIKRESAYSSEANAAWRGLFSDEVLRESREQEAYVRFSHNILFDFAVTVHVLEPSAAKLAAFIAEEPARPLFLRPSLLYHFTRLWHFDRTGFWRNFWAVIQHEAVYLRQIIRLVLPTVVVNEGRTPKDLEPLLTRLATSQPGAADATAFLLQALRVLSAPQSDLWADFVRSIGPFLDYGFAWDAGLVASAIVESNPLVPDAACGEFARQLMRWAWQGRSSFDKKQWLERLVGSIAIPLIAKTYSTNKPESRLLLQEVLKVVGEPEFPIDCIYRLVNETDSLIAHDPEFVGEIYEKVFGYLEASDAQTHMGGHVLPLVSNRRQDYEMCRFVLIEKFPRFIASNAQLALRAGIRSIEAYVFQKHLFDSISEGKTFRDLISTFQFRNAVCCYIEDNSYIWGQSSYPDQELKIADAIFDWLEDAIRTDSASRIELFLGCFQSESRIAFMWSRLLLVAAERPTTLGPKLWEMAASKSLLDKLDLTYSLGSFLESVVEFLDSEQRRAIERSIVCLTENVDDDRKKVLEHFQARLLARIPPVFLVSSEAVALRRSLEQGANLPENRPIFSMGSGSWEPYTEDVFLREHGAEPESPQNRRMRDLYAPLVAWNEKGKQETQIDSLLTTAQDLWSALRRSDEVHPSVSRVAWEHLASFASSAITLTHRADTERFRILRELVLSAAEQAEPLPDTERDLKWNTAIWSPAPRNQAAQVLPWMIGLEADERGLKAVKKLATDPVPSVRFLLFSELWRLLVCSPGLMWALFDEIAQGETNTVVVQGVILSLSHLIGPARDKSLALIRKLAERMDEESRSDAGVKSGLILMIVDYAVLEGDSWAKDMLRLWRGDPLNYSATMSIAGQRLIAYITPQHLGRRLELARELLLLHLDAVARVLADLQRHSPTTALEQLRKKWKSLYDVVDQTVMRIYFAADVNAGLRRRKEQPLEDDIRERFFREALPLLEKVLDFGKQRETGVLLAPTAHHFIELLNGVTRYDPSLVIRMAADVVSCSKRYGYNLDSMAMAEIVRLVESVLADYRSEIQDDESIERLLQILDAFAEVGWPEALQLVWRLDEIYR